MKILLLNMQMKYPIKTRFNADNIIDVVCGLSIIFILPFFFSINSIINYGIRWALGCIFVICVALKDRNLCLKIVAILISGMAYTLLYMYHVRMAYGEGQASYITRSMLCWLYMSFAVYYSKYRNRTNNQRVGKIFTVVIVFTIITSIIGMRRFSYLTKGYETIVRTLGNGGDYSEEAKKLINRNNIASWQLAYGIALSSVAYMWKYRKEHKRIDLLVVFIIIYFLIKSQITFALIFSLVPVLHYYVKKRSMTVQIVTYVFAFVLFLILYLFRSAFFYMLYELMINSGMTMLGIRFYQLYEATKIGGLVGTGAGRLEYYFLSLKQFLNYPLLGYRLKDQSELFVKLGMHSQVFDTLGGTGIVGFLLYFCPFIYVIKRVRKSCLYKIDKSFISLGIIVLFVFMLTNPTSFACEAYMAVFCLPLWLRKSDTVSDING